MNAEMNSEQSRLKKLDLLGSLGAGVLGAGLALMFSEWLRPFAIPALLIGAITHGWAMFDKHRIEKAAQVIQPRWITMAYWGCWVLVLALFFYIGIRSFAVYSTH